MIQAVLFDLDNTLILFEESKFFEAYYKQLYLSFTDLLSPQQFFEKLMQSTRVMVENDGRMNNAQHFINHFAKGMDVSADELWQRFEEFYATKFEQFQYLMEPLPDARDVIRKIQSLGLKTVIATNPMFPMNVQQIRLRWAGLEDVTFNLVTSADNFNLCKPNLDYYLKISDEIGVPPEKCLMVGNDPFNDMIANKTGMKTYLTTDSNHYSIELSQALAKNVSSEMPEPDYKGKFRDILDILND